MTGPAAATVGSGPAADPEAPYVRLAVVAIVREPAEGRWLLIRAPRDQESWGPPGGRVERGEDLADALHRELMEEVGLHVLTAGPCFAYVTMHKGERTVGVHMACRSAGAAPRLCLDPAEAADHRWVTAREWVEMAHAGLTPWDPADVVRVTTLADALLEIA
jgi:ADP-ribose pyrophosphatase YjhB (NUDIX family)